MSWQDNLKINWYFFKPYKASVFWLFVIMIGSGILESLNLAALYPIINYGLNLSGQNPFLARLEQFFQSLGSENYFLYSCLLLIAITVISTVVKIFYSVYTNRLIKRIVSDTQLAIFKKFENAPYAYFVKSQQGDLIYASTVSPLYISSNVMFIARMANGLMSCLFFTALMFVLSWQAAILMFVIGLVYSVFVKSLITKLINESSKLVVEADSEKNIILNEFITGIKTIRIFLSTPFWQKKYAQAVEKSTYNNYKVLMGKMLPDSFMKFIFNILIASLGILFSFQNRENIIVMIPLLGTFVAVASRLVPYINMVGNDFLAAARCMPDVEKVYGILHENMETKEHGTKTLPEFQHDIAFDHVSFKYEGMKSDLLDDVSFNIEKNKVTAIVGTSGVGKSTIINLLFKLYEVSEGEIRVDGININELGSESYLSQIGYVGQETFIFNGTVKENILFGRENATEEQLMNATRLANAHTFIINLDKGYDTLVGDAGVKLSGGQRQRIAIARAMLTKPSIIVFDEATSSLDNISEKAVQEAVENISRHTTVLVIAHRLSSIQHADKIIVLEKGKIIEEGSHEQLVEKGKLYSQLYAEKKSL
jgi:ABC-type multidrug transport system fused ATPase/permease subunit